MRICYTYHMNDKIHIRNQASLRAKLESFHRHNTRVVADFDNTITTYGGPTSWSLLRTLPHFPKEYYQAYASLYEKYHLYETDETLDANVWLTYMRAWWQENLDLFRKYHIHRDHLKSIDISRVHVRNGIREAFEFFDQEKIPLLILSAGIHQTIEMILDGQKIPETHRVIIANELLFDTNNVYMGVYPADFIHVGNKNEQEALKHTKTNSLKARNKIILLGDHLKDIQMIQPHEREDTIAIGFCSSDTQHSLEKYQEIFDIVVVSDTSDEGILSEII